MKVIKSFENSGILLKGKIRAKITRQERGFFNFFRPLMKTSLALMKNVPTPLTKNLLLPFGLSVAVSAVDATIQKTFMDQELQN